MNERIRKLAGQAKFMAEEDINKQISYNTELKAFAEKFAELIVREALNEMGKQMDKFGDDQSNNPTWYKSIEAVEKHFGVKE